MVTMTDEQSGTKNEADSRQTEMVDVERWCQEEREKEDIRGRRSTSKQRRRKPLRRGREKKVEETERGHSNVLKPEGIRLNFIRV